MARKRFTTEQIITRLREAEVRLAQGKTVVHRWRKEYGGLKMDQAKRFKALEKENGRLKKLVSDWSLDNQILKEVSSGNFNALPTGGEQCLGSGSSDGDPGASSNVGPAACRDRRDPRSAESARSPMRQQIWWSGWWSWPTSTVETATAGSRPCCVGRDGRSIISGW